MTSSGRVEMVTIWVLATAIELRAALRRDVVALAATQTRCWRVSLAMRVWEASAGAQPPPSLHEVPAGAAREERRRNVAHGNRSVTGSVNEDESRDAADDSQDSGSASL